MNGSGEYARSRQRSTIRVPAMHGIERRVRRPALRRRHDRLLDFAAQELRGQWILHVSLDCPPQRSRTKDGVIPGADQPATSVISHLQRHRHVRQVVSSVSLSISRDNRVQMLLASDGRKMMTSSSLFSSSGRNVRFSSDSTLLRMSASAPSSPRAKPMACL